MIYSDDSALIGTEGVWIVTAEFEDWTVATQPASDPGQSETASAKVIYASGCTNPTSFSPPSN